MIVSPTVTDLDYQGLVNWDDPLTQGLAYWHLNLPGRWGGTRAYDLASGRVSTRTNMASPPTSTSGQGTTTRSGGWGEERVTIAADGHIRLSPALNFDASTSVLFWFQVASVAPAGQVLFGDSGSAQTFLNLLTPGASIIIRDRVSGVLTFVIPTLSAGIWYHLAVIRDADGTAHLYLNGVESSSGGQALAAGNPFPLDLLGAYFTATNGLGGMLDNLMFFAGRLSLAFLRDIYTDSRTGHQRMLRRVGVVVGGGEAAGFTQSLGGTLASSGTMPRTINKALVGAV